jgi:hypothetical protein
MDLVRFENHGSSYTIWPEASRMDNQMVRGGGSDAYISRQISLVQQVCGTEGTSAQKALEIPQAAHVGQRPHVAFQIGGEIRVGSAARISAKDSVSDSAMSARPGWVSGAEGVAQYHVVSTYAKYPTGTYIFASFQD